MLVVASSFDGIHVELRQRETILCLILHWATILMEPSIFYKTYKKKVGKKTKLIGTKLYLFGFLA